MKKFKMGKGLKTLGIGAIIFHRKRDHYDFSDHWWPPGIEVALSLVNLQSALISFELRHSFLCNL